MSKIRVVTDSTADLTQTLVDQYQIEVVSLDVMVEGKTYKDKVDLTNDEFYEMLRGADALPTTSQPSPAAFAGAYKKLAAEGAETIFSIHLANELSGTYQSSVLGASMVEDQVKVINIDSRSATIGLGLIIKYAVEMIEGGANADDVEAKIRDIIANQQLYFLLDSLDNLHKGGRIGKASHLFGTLLNIKPVLSLSDGVISAYEKVRGNKERKALERLIEILAEKIDPNKKVYCVLGYCDNIETAKYIEERLKDRIHCDEYVYQQIGTVVATHVGMGAVGMAFYQE